jgi:hypothetical protein
MTVVFIILFAIVLMGAGLARELLSMNRAAPSFLDGETIQDYLSRPVNYQAMGRLFSEEDCRFVGGHAGAMRRWTSQRRRAMRLYLKQLRADFQFSWSICRLLTPVSQDPDFATMLVKQWIQFHILYGVLNARCALGYGSSTDQQVQMLVRSLSTLRTGAAGILGDANLVASFGTQGGRA